MSKRGEARRGISTLAPRICKVCGVTFDGGPRAWYCPTCRAERRRQTARKQRQHGPARPIGSTDLCQHCGKPYIVDGGQQKYCKACSHIAVRKIDRVQSKAWNHEHKETYYPAKNEARRSKRTTSTCAVCGKDFPLDPLHAARRYCSEECRAIGRHQTALASSRAATKRNQAKRKEAIAAQFPPGAKLISVREYADRHDLSVEVVWQRIRAGWYKSAVKIGTYWYLDTEDMGRGQ